MPAVLKPLQWLLETLRRIVALAVILIFVYMIGAVVAQVIGRYVFNFAVAGAEETATMAQIWMVLLAAGLAMRKGLHVGVDVMVQHLPVPLLRVINLVVSALALWFLWVLFEGSFQLLKIGSFQRSPALQIPMFYAYLVLPIGAAYFALEFVATMLPRIIGDPKAAARAASEAHPSHRGGEALS